MKQNRLDNRCSSNTTRRGDLMRNATREKGRNLSTRQTTTRLSRSRSKTKRESTMKASLMVLRHKTPKH